MVLRLFVSYLTTSRIITCDVTGGDDVQQLCDAGEEEFLEIMALVGMASKPLHVRRLQKALQEWLTNPCKVSPYYYLWIFSMKSKIL